MSEANIKKIIVKREDLPAFSGVGQSHLVRYRIVSEDRNRTSHWSPYYSVIADSAPEVECIVSIIENSVNLIWSQPEEYNIKQFDIYFKINNQDWKYISSSTSTQFATLISPSATILQFAIQIPTYPKQFFTEAAIYVSEPINL
jgi:hypothetical protein